MAPDDMVHLISILSAEHETHKHDTGDISNAQANYVCARIKGAQ